MHLKCTDIGRFTGWALLGQTLFVESPAREEHNKYSVVWCCRRPVIVGSWQRWQNNRLMMGARWCSYGLLGWTITAFRMSCRDRCTQKTLFNNDKKNQVDIGFAPRLGEFLPPTLLQHSCGVQPTETIWPRPAARSFKMALPFVLGGWLARYNRATTATTPWHVKIYRAFAATQRDLQAGATRQASQHRAYNMPR